MQQHRMELVARLPAQRLPYGSLRRLPVRDRLLVEIATGRGCLEATFPPVTFAGRALNKTALLEISQIAIERRGVDDHPVRQFPDGKLLQGRSEEHTYELQSLMRISYA